MEGFHRKSSEVEYKKGGLFSSESTTSARVSANSAGESTKSAEESTTKIEESTTKVEESTTKVGVSANSAEENTKSAEESTTKIEESTTKVRESTTFCIESKCNVFHLMICWYTASILMEFSSTFPGMVSIR